MPHPLSAIHRQYLSILDADGRLDRLLRPLSPDDLRRLYRAMQLGRRLDERMLRLQRQGRIGTFAPIKGQEASQLGSAFCLLPTDWMVPSFRETAAMVWRGWPIEKLLLFFSGYLEGGQPAPDQRDLPITIPVATQLPHAVGLAYAAYWADRRSSRLLRRRATSENFPGPQLRGRLAVPSFRLPEQSVTIGSAEETNTLSHARGQALAYGLPGIQVDATTSWPWWPPV
jgi:pyruvate dehydrogenase E1 component alpha subunit